MRCHRFRVFAVLCLGATLGYLAATLELGARGAALASPGVAPDGEVVVSNSLDRTVLPIPEPTYPRITNLDVRIAAAAEAEVAKLEIAIKDEGPRAEIGEITFSGNQRDSEAEILHYLDLHPGPLRSRSPRRIATRGREGPYVLREMNP